MKVVESPPAAPEDWGGGELVAGGLPAGEPTPLVPGLGAGAAELPATTVPGEPADD